MLGFNKTILGIKGLLTTVASCPPVFQRPSHGQSPTDSGRKEFSVEAAFQGASLHFSNEHVFATFKMQSHENRVIRENEFSVEGAFQSDSLHFSNKPAFATFRTQSHGNRVIRRKEFSVAGAFQAASVHISNEPFFCFYLPRFKRTEGLTFTRSTTPSKESFIIRNPPFNPQSA